ncbi:MAG: sensor domain-containing diguanylate cyclase [Candidatus Limnocylindrales bacterium]
MSERADATTGAELLQAGSADASGPDARIAHRIGIVRLVIAGAVACLAGLSVAALADGDVIVRDFVLAALVILLAGGMLVHGRLSSSLAELRRSRETGMTRILQGLSRSMSPAAVVDAIVAELSQTSAADHVVVARVRRPDGVIEVTLVTARATTPASRTWIRPEPAAARADPAQAADAIAARVRAAYGLPYTLAEPLVAEGQLLGALILSRRTREPWGDAERRLLGWAALEVSAAFARAYALEEAERESHLDALTGLPNRRYFDELLAIMGPRRREADSLAILMVDVDHFKRLNDRHGHAVGDDVLRHVAGAIARSLRAEDTPVRYGGEEFAVILRRASAPQAAEVGERIRHAVAGLEPATMGVDARVTVSVGVAVAGAEEVMGTVIERADQALYRAKRRGRDRVEEG